MSIQDIIWRRQPPNSMQEAFYTTPENLIAEAAGKTHLSRPSALTTQKAIDTLLGKPLLISTDSWYFLLLLSMLNIS